MFPKTKITVGSTPKTERSEAGNYIGGVRELKRFGLSYYQWFVISRSSRSVVAQGEFMESRYAYRAAERTINSLNRLSQGV